MRVAVKLRNDWYHVMAMCVARHTQAMTNRRCSIWYIDGLVSLDLRDGWITCNRWTGCSRRQPRENSDILTNSPDRFVGMGVSRCPLLVDRRPASSNCTSAIPEYALWHYPPEIFYHVTVAAAGGHKTCLGIRVRTEFPSLRATLTVRTRRCLIMGNSARSHAVMLPSSVTQVPPL